MKIVLNKKEGVLVNLYFENELTDYALKLKDANRFFGKAGEVYSNLDLENQGELFVGLGKKVCHEDLRLAGFKLAEFIKKNKLPKVSLKACMLGDDKEKLVVSIIEGLYHGTYKFDRYLSKKENHEFTVYLKHVSKELEKDLAELKVVMESLFLTRDLINTPAIDLYPEVYANIIKDTFKDLPVEVTVFDKKEMEKNKMHAALAVGSGSDRDPRFVVLKYQPNKKSDEFYALVGKGITYDSGGYAIKPAGSMLEMNTDMSGSAAVVGAIRALALNKVQKNVVGVMALCENLVSGHAYKNGDIISSMKGLSIQIDNTDAEGRVTMADSLYYAATKFNSKFIVELSTLTGACIVALGTDVTGSISTCDRLFEEVYLAGQKSGELIHRFPITKKLEEAVKGTFGDIKNVCQGGGGSITAGIFLTHFVEEKPYVHLDIAGTAYIKPYSYYANGATGVGVRTLYNLIKETEF